MKVSAFMDFITREDRQYTNKQVIVISGGSKCYEENEVIEMVCL